jgi:hypothetical protein
MRPIAALFLLASAAAFAQTRPPEPSDRWDKAKTDRIMMRYADDVRARKAFDEAHKALQTAAFKAAVRNYEAGKLPALHATWGEFVTAQGTEYIALQLAPSAATYVKPGSKVMAFGEIVDAGGKTVYDFEELADVVDSKGEPYVERTLILPAHNVVGTFGLAVGGEVVAMTRSAMEAESLTKTTTGVSRLIVSNNVYNLAKLQSPFDPFAFGGTKVVPKPDRTFKKSEEVWLFTELRNPAVDAQQTPHVMTRIEIEGSGKRVSMLLSPAEASPLKGVRGHYGVGTTVDLSRFKAGEYKVRFTVNDTLANQTWQREETIHLLD